MLPVAFIIVNNSSYRALEEFGRHFNISTLPGVQLPHLDFCALATGHGVRALRVDRCEDLDAALQQVFAAKVPMLLEVASNADAIQMNERTGSCAVPTDTGAVEFAEGRFEATAEFDQLHVARAICAVVSM